jgi:tRNA(fMet)-specific endonuclease VapC
VLALDTNTLIHFFKGAGRVADHMLGTSPREIAIPAVVLFELEVGIARSSRPQQRRRQLGEFLSAVTVLPLGIEEARAAAQVRAALERAGTPIGPLDTLIAGTALAHRATLVTHNVAEFSRVPSLAVVDWF